MVTLAMVFPGQASQKVGMLSELADNCILRETFNEASRVLGYDLWNLIQFGPVEELNKTYRAQPAILATSVAIWKLWNYRGGRLPVFMAGHSLGEYSALVCSGVIDFSSAIKLVELRGIFMQTAVLENIGAMSVIIGLNEDIVIEVCRKVRSDNQFVAISAFNAPNYVVISGYKEAVENVNVICRQLGAKFLRILPISVPSHCELMISAAKKLKKVLETIDFSIPSISVINNVDVCIGETAAYIKQALVRQMYTPVRWYEIIQYLLKLNINILLEIGPGQALSTMARYIINDGNVIVMSVNDMSSLNIAIKY